MESRLIEMNRKPPLGLMPENIWIQMRIEEIKQAIERYINANIEVPIHWISEYNKLLAFKNLSK